MSRRLLLLLPLLALTAGAATLAPVALALAAPWLAAVVWVVVRSDVDSGDRRAFPSYAEDARRRLSAR